MSNNPYAKSQTTPTINEPDAPPAYSDSAAAPTSGKRTSTSSTSGNASLGVPGATMSNSSAQSLIDEDRELPPGWTRQWDPTQKHHFYVDTKAKPPRSIWVHPYDDPQYIASIPDKQAPAAYAPPSGPPPPTSPSRGVAGSSAANAQHDKGFFGNLKNKLQGTPEERERRRIEAQQREAEMRIRYEQRQQDIRSQGYPGQYGAAQPGYGGGYGQPAYGGGGYAPQQPAYGGYAPQPAYAPQPYYQPQYAPPQQQYQQRSSGFGGGGMALPLLGGLAGGFLLGDIIGDAGDGGGDGGDGGDGGGDGGW